MSVKTLAIGIILVGLVVGFIVTDRSGAFENATSIQEGDRAPVFEITTLVR